MADKPATLTAGKIGFVAAASARLFIFVRLFNSRGYVRFCLSKIGFVLNNYSSIVLRPASFVACPKSCVHRPSSCVWRTRRGFGYAGQADKVGPLTVRGGCGFDANIGVFLTGLTELSCFQ